MGKPRTMKASARIVVIAALALTLAIPFMAAGCGASTPAQAVSNFYKAIETRDWNAYLDAVYPENVRRMTGSDVTTEKKKFEQADFKYTGLEFKTIPDAKDKNSAQVELTAGTITGTNPSTNQKESTTIAEIKKSYNITPTVDVRKYKGSWYVDVPMAAADTPTQQQQQQTP